MDKQFGITDAELKDAYVEQMTSLRVLKATELIICCVVRAWWVWRLVHAMG